MKKVLITLAVITVTVLSCKKDKEKVPTAPVVTTAALTNVAGGNATAGGSIVSDGGAPITQSGIAWSKINATPSLTDSVVASTATNGVFTVNINGIDFGNTYYFRAFATNSIGTSYGAVVTLTTSSDSVRFTYNGELVTYGIITSPASGKKWLDRNLGATQAATSYDDYKAYGDLFQWGRPADGHQLINWTSSTTGTPVNGTTEVLATSDTPGHSNFIIPPYTATSLFDWRDDNNRNRWASNPQGPCPAGWHVPTQTEWNAETNGSGGTAGGFSNSTEAYNQLKLTVGGLREEDGPNDEEFHVVGAEGEYWCSDDYYNQYSAPYSQGIPLEIGLPDIASTGFQYSKEHALSVRCIKNN